jgi:hypothetical protein
MQNRFSATQSLLEAVDAFDVCIHTTLYPLYCVPQSRTTNSTLAILTIHKSFFVDVNEMAGTRTLVVLGSRPGIGVSIASLWAKHGFEKVALLARDPARLQNDSKSLSEAVAAAKRAMEVTPGSWI